MSLYKIMLGGNVFHVADNPEEHQAMLERLQHAGQDMGALTLVAP